MTKSEIARYISKSTTASNAEIVQFFHSNFYKERLNEEDYLDDFIKFKTELDECLLENKNWSIDNTFLKGKTSLPPKLPKKVKMEMERKYKEDQDYIKEVIRQIKED